MDDKATKNAVAALDNISPEAFSSEAAQYAVKEAARRLLARIQTPFEHAWGLTAEYPYLFAAVQVGIDLGIFEGRSKAGGDKASLKDLLTFCNKECETNPLHRCPVHEYHPQTERLIQSYLCRPSVASSC